MIIINEIFFNCVTKSNSHTKILLYLGLLNKRHCKKTYKLLDAILANKEPETKTNINLISFVFIYNICMNVTQTVNGIPHY